MKKMYLVTTKHLEKSLWFRDAEDFRVAMNYIAIVAWKHPEVIVWGHIYMSNHAHFILLGTEEDVIAFVNSVKQRYSLYYRRKYGVKKLLRRNFLDVKEIPEGVGAVPELMLPPHPGSHRQKEKFVDVRAGYGDVSARAVSPFDCPPPKKPDRLQAIPSSSSFIQVGVSYSSSGYPHSFPVITGWGPAGSSTDT